MLSISSLRDQNYLYLYLIRLFRIFRELFLHHYDERNGPYVGVQIILPPIFVLSDHSVCHFGTKETFSRWQGTILGILIPVLPVLLERKNIFCTR